VRYDGDLDGEQSLQLTSRSRPISGGAPHVFLLIDISKIGKISAEARKHSGRGGKDLNLRGMAIIGASAPMRIVVGMVGRAVDLLNGNTDNPTRFFESEAAARAWIAERREAVKQK
jgi:hypothetical protein